MPELTLFDPAPPINNAIVEEWRAVPVPPFDTRYSVSSHGHARTNAVSHRWSMTGGRLLTRIPIRGCYRVTLNFEGKQASRAICDLVAVAFLGEPPTPKHRVIRRDGNKWNDDASNLTWGIPAAAEPTPIVVKPTQGGDLPGEEWRPVPYPGYAERYSVSNLGRVKSFRGHLLWGGWTPSAYKGRNAGTVLLTYKKPVVKRVSVHQLVARAFIGPPPSPKHIVCHKDDDHSNCTVQNLYWGTQADNGRDRSRNLRLRYGENHHSAKITDEMVRDIRAEYVPYKVSQESLAKKHGIDQTTVSAIVLGQSWKHVPM